MGEGELSAKKVSQLFFDHVCNFLEFLLMYSMTEMFVLQLSFGRVYGRYLVPRLSSLQLTIHRLMVRLRDKTEL